MSKSNDILTTLALYNVCALTTSKPDDVEYRIKLLRNEIKPLVDKESIKGRQEALHKAAFEGYFDICKMLIDSGIKPTYEALHNAVWMCHYDIAELFLKAGVKPDMEGKEGVLHGACYKTYLKMAVLLIESGSDVKNISDRGDSVIMTAVKHFCNLGPPYTEDGLTNHGETDEFCELIKLLIDNGADRNLPSKGGETPVFVAACKDYKRVVDILLNYKIERKINESRGE